MLGPGRPFVLADVVGSRFEAYDRLQKEYALYATLTKDPKLLLFLRSTPGRAMLAKCW